MSVYTSWCSKLVTHLDFPYIHRLIMPSHDGHCGNRALTRNWFLAEVEEVEEVRPRRNSLAIMSTVASFFTSWPFGGLEGNWDLLPSPPCMADIRKKKNTRRGRKKSNSSCNITEICSCCCDDTKSFLSHSSGEESSPRSHQPTTQCRWVGGWVRGCSAPRTVYFAIFVFTKVSQQ